MPLMVEDDHATTWESPWTPNTDNWTELTATYDD